ncbi:MAG TPA: hypothetical protein DDZ66_06530 [Firmicutes bacterium]|nr:hypothetical protein [Bacillota bacterium]
MERLQKKWIGRFTLSLLIVVLAIGIVFADDSLLITGLLDEDTVVPLSMIRELPQLTQDVVAVNSAGKESHFTVTGALFDDLLATYGKQQENILGIRLIASDGYSIDVPREVLVQREIILAYLTDGMLLDERSEPLRAIIPEERAMYWVRNLIQIEIIDQVQSAEITTIRFLESLTEIQPLEDYAYYAEIDQAINIQEIVENLGLDQKPERVFFQASDGFEKNETYEEFSSGYIKMTGTSAPLFLSPKLPKGMQVKDIVFFTVADNGFVSLTQAFDYYAPKTQDDVVGISLAELMADLGVVKSDLYRLTAIDGYEVEVTAEDMASGYVYFDEDQVRSYFPGLRRNTSVLGLYTIEAVR